MDERAQDAYNGIKASKVALDIVEESKINLANLRLMVLTEDEKQFVARMQSLPLVLEHRSSDAEDSGWQKIKGGTKEHGGTKNLDAKLLSLLELAKLLAPSNNITQLKGKAVGLLRMADVNYDDIKAMLGNVKINTSLKDFQNFGNVDFVFFKLNVAGHVNAEVGYAGVAKGKPKFFKPSLLSDAGFISLDDWVSYSAGDSFSKNLNTVWYGFVTEGLKVEYSKDPYRKTYTYTSYKSNTGKPFLQHGVAKNPAATLVKEMKQEVFFGADIIPGLSLTLVEHLRLADPSGAWMKSALATDFNAKVSKLAAEIWRLIEAKVPGSMRYYDSKISKALAKGATSTQKQIADHRPKVVVK